MGLTGASFSDNYEAVWNNPAGLGRARSTALGLGVQGGVFRLTLNGERSALDPYQATTIGFQLPLPFGGPLEDVLTMGTMIIAPLQTVLQTDIIYPEIPQWSVLSRTQSVHLHLGLGINLDRLVPGLRIGAGVAATANIDGRLTVKLEPGDQFVSETETQLLTAFSPGVGAQLDVGDFQFGLAWRSELISEIDLGINVEGLPIALPRITITAVPQYDPHTISLEGAWRPNRRMLIALQLAYRRWSQWPGVVGKTTSSSNTPPDPDFSDTISPRLGFEYRVGGGATEGTIRAGYSFEMTPAPASRLAPALDSEGNQRMGDDGSPLTTPVRYIDNHRHILSVGGGFRHRTAVGLGINLDLFGQLHRVATREHDIPLEGETDPLISGGWILVGGATLGVEWGGEE